MTLTPLTGAVTAFGHFRGDVHQNRTCTVSGRPAASRAMTTAAQFRCVHRVPNGGTSCGRRTTVTRFHGHDHGAHVEVNGLFAHEDLAFVHGHMTGVVGFNLPVQKRGTGCERGTRTRVLALATPGDNRHYARVCIRPTGAEYKRLSEQVC